MVLIDALCQVNDAGINFTDITLEELHDYVARMGYNMSDKTKEFSIPKFGLLIILQNERIEVQCICQAKRFKYSWKQLPEKSIFIRTMEEALLRVSA